MGMKGKITGITKKNQSRMLLGWDGIGFVECMFILLDE